LVGPKILKEYLINYARPLIYSTFTSFSNLASVKAAYEMLIAGETVEVTLQTRLIMRLGGLFVVMYYYFYPLRLLQRRFFASKLAILSFFLVCVCCFLACGQGPRIDPLFQIQYPNTPAYALTLNIADSRDRHERKCQSQRAQSGIDPSRIKRQTDSLSHRSQGQRTRSDLSTFP